MMQRMKNTTSATWTGIFLIVLGTLFLFQRFGWIQVGRVLGLLWPLLLIYLGWTLYRQDQDTRQLSSDEGFTKTSIFSDFNESSRAKHFKHGKIWSVFGDGTIDLREAKLEPGASLDIVAVFSDIKLHAPPNTTFQVNALNLISDVYTPDSEGPSPQEVIITGFTLFSDIKVKPSTPTPVATPQDAESA